MARKYGHARRNDLRELRELRKFVAPEVVFGVGARQLAGQHARNLGAQHALLVTDSGVIGAGWSLPLPSPLYSFKPA